MSYDPDQLAGNLHLQFILPNSSNQKAILAPSVPYTPIYSQEDT